MKGLPRTGVADLLRCAAEHTDSPRATLQLELIAARMRDTDELAFATAYDHAAFYLLVQS